MLQAHLPTTTSSALANGANRPWAGVHWRLQFPAQFRLQSEIHGLLVHSTCALPGKLYFGTSISNTLPAIQILPEFVFPADGVLPVHSSHTNRIAHHLLGTARLRSDNHAYS